MARKYPSETEFIDSLQRAVHTGVKPRGLVAGIGDDAAIIRAGNEDLVLTNDILVEGRHFRREWFSGVALGWRAAAVNLSDVAAMGAKPRFALVSLAIPPRVGAAYVRALERGVAEHLANYDAAVIGGNVSGTDGPLVCDITLVGACKRGAAWRRTARPGDAILVAGQLGSAAVGLRALEGSSSARGALVNAYRKPVPRLDVVRLLRNERAVRGAIDVSDGLSTDLIHVCTNAKVGCEVERSALPITRALRAWCVVNEEDPVAWVLRGGEDYALLLSVAARSAERIRKRIESSLGIPANVVGRFTNEAGVCTLLGTDGTKEKLVATGWDHFR